MERGYAKEIAWIAVEPPFLIKYTVKSPPLVHLRYFRLPVHATTGSYGSAGMSEVMAARCFTRMPLFARTVGRGGRVLECSTLHQDYSAPDTRLIPMGGMLLYQHLEKHPPFIILSPPARESSPPS